MRIKRTKSVFCIFFGLLVILTTVLSGVGSISRVCATVPNQERTVEIEVDDSCQFLLAKSGFEIGFSSGDDQTQYQHVLNSGTSITGAYPANRDKVYFNITVTDEYFIPSMRAVVTYADGTTRDVSDGTADMGNRNLAVDLPLIPGTCDVTLHVYLDVDKQTSANSSSSHVDGLVKYNVCDTSGHTNISDNSAVSLSIAEASDDQTAASRYGNRMDGTLDLGFTVGGSAQAQLDKDVQVTLAIDTSVYDAENYIVVRNHNGTLTELNTRYVPQAGILMFSTDRFSSYSLVSTSAPASASNDEVVKREFNAILENKDALSGLNIGTIATDTYKPEVTSSVTSQGERFYAATAFVIPQGYREAFSFNILEDGKAVFDQKTGTIKLRIPAFYRHAGRSFGIAVVDKDGKPYYLEDLDNSDDYITVNVNFVGYAFEVVFKD
jgi:hypothetical protein